MHSTDYNDNFDQLWGGGGGGERVSLGLVGSHARETFRITDWLNSLSGKGHASARGSPQLIHA